MSAKYAFSSGLREVRFHLCHSSTASEAARSFLKRAYPTMKKHNPHTPILIREATGIDPKIWTRFGFGKESSESLAGILPTEEFEMASKADMVVEGLSDKEIEDRVTRLVQIDS